MLVASAGGGLYLRLRIEGDPKELATSYFAYWQAGDFHSMRELAAAPPADFVEQHRAFSKALRVSSLLLKPEPAVRSAENEAKAEFTASRTLPPGKWTVRSTLRMKVVDRRWRVIWSPATLVPELKKGGLLQLREIPGGGGGVATYAGGGEIPDTAGVRQYLDALTGQYASGEEELGWGVFLDGRPVKIFSEPTAARRPTTLDEDLQAAADKAVAAAASPAILVALRPSTGEIVALADTVGSLAASQITYPPGSTFKIVTAAALVTSGLSASSGVACPATVLIGERTIPNHNGLALGSTSLRTAFAKSCNTTFADLGVNRAGAAGMTAAAEMFGFNRPFAINAVRASFPEPSGTADLAEASIGQGRVMASPLAMAAVAAAVASGTWRSPIMFPADAYWKNGEKVPDPRKLPADVLAPLRTMMSAVVTSGTAASVALPSGTHGKTGTAETASGAPHSWFIGYRADLAFAALIPHAPTPTPNPALPLTTSFLTP
ncbi:penicillin-binding transpeptidase domain-containing protein [Actinocorallia sp. A-T 12471]|uniref:penicillin-binding transpeptidase domain-containing protein n=1 Tax=Actinocorallia sp. A-T 12471 TaxID=3089813 RepID=UPI0029D37688|nr:penicillin-binding transpeptidase domain-containing protein [Actinocorallia sp. A-T 12471]MDX6739221.1 penicillin-binding transpeptidase domain-containing protein [Actinocorallia sp. A-T 12471]